MKLAQLFEALERGPLLRQPLSRISIPDVDVRSLTHDSRQVGRGDLFVALKGLKSAGADFAADAISRGAVAVVADDPPPQSAGVPWLVVTDARQAMARLADEFYGHPSQALRVVGITGTNGKTTTAYLLRAVF